MSVYKRGSNWWIKVCYGRGENLRSYRKAAGSFKKEALKAEAAVRAKIAAGDFSFLDPRPAGTMLFDLVTRYLESWSRTRKTAASQERDRGTLELFKGHNGNRPLAAITQRDIEGYVKKRLDEGVANDTVNRELHTIKHLFTKAVEWGDVETSVAHKVKNLKSPPGRLCYLTVEEAHRLLAECRKSPSRNLHDIVLTALHTGARRGELFRMKWEQVDFSNRTIKIVGTKNGTIRIVPMTDGLYECLSARPHYIKGQYVFFGRFGEEVKYIYVSFWKAVEAAGLHDCRFHDLRHTYASWLVQGGEDIYRVKELLGHKDVRMTQRYAHLAPGFQASTAVRLNAMWRGGSELDAERPTGTVAQPRRGRI